MSDLQGQDIIHGTAAVIIIVACCSHSWQQMLYVQVFDLFIHINLLVEWRQHLLASAEWDQVLHLTLSLLK